MFEHHLEVKIFDEKFRHPEMKMNLGILKSLRKLEQIFIILNEPNIWEIDHC